MSKRAVNTKYYNKGAEAGRNNSVLPVLSVTELILLKFILTCHHHYK